MKRSLLVVALIAALFSSAVRPSYAVLDKTRFALHLGAGFFAFHHWVYKPYKQGMFATGAQGRTKSLVKAGLALLFAVHEARAANNIAQKSKSPTLQALVRPINSLSSAFSSIGQRFKSGRFAPGDVSSLDSAVSSLGVASANGGIPVKDVPVAIPGM